MATLSFIRKRLVDLSGRLDLLEQNEDGSAQADFFIQAGQRLLDSLAETPSAKRWYIPDSLTSGGEHVFKVQNLRRILEVWIVDSANDQDRRFVEPKTLRWLRAEYNEVLTSADYGTPVYYAPLPIGVAPELKNKTASDYSSIPDTDFLLLSDESGAPHYGYQGVLVLPACQANLSIQIYAEFYDDALTSDSDQSYWSTRFPEALVLAAQASIESIEHRNITGYQGFLQAMSPYIQAAIADRVYQDEADAGNIMQMGDSWSESG